MIAQVAELVDAHVSGACVERHAGSSPVLGTLFVKRASFAEIAQLVEHNLAKVRVASSSLVFRSFLCFVKETERRCVVMHDAPSFLFITIQIGLFSSSCDNSKISLIYVSPASK